jgi:hypothetical protein
MDDRVYTSHCSYVVTLGRPVAARTAATAHWPIASRSHRRQGRLALISAQAIAAYPHLNLYFRPAGSRSGPESAPRAVAQMPRRAARNTDSSPAAPAAAGTPEKPDLPKKPKAPKQVRNPVENERRAAPHAAVLNVYNQ